MHYLSGEILCKMIIDMISTEIIPVSILSAVHV